MMLITTMFPSLNSSDTLSASLSLLLLLLLPSLVSSACTEGAQGVAVGDPSSNTCVYPACFFGTPAPENAASWTCVYDETFCGRDDTFIPVADVLEAGRRCTCTDILSFPDLIGVCQTKGVNSPMAIASDCPDGQAVCPATEIYNGPVYVTGDPDLAASSVFTSCDLPCHHANSHLAEAPTDTYRQCQVPSFEWAVASASLDGSMVSANTKVVGTTLVVAGHLWSTDTDPTDGVDSDTDVVMKGPYTSGDPTGASATRLNHNAKAYAGRRPYELALLFIDTTTGTPTSIFGVPGEGTTYCNSMDVSTASATSDTVIIMSGELSPEGDMVYNTKSCTPIAGHGGMAITCSSDSATTTLTAHNTSYTAYVASFALDGTMNWMTVPWPDMSAQEEASIPTAIFTQQSSSGVASDTDGNAYVVGYRSIKAVDTEDASTFFGVITKLDANTGTTLWEQVFPEIKHVIQIMHDPEDDSLYITAEIIGTAEAGGALGDVTCDDSPGDCSLLLRLGASDGVVQWVRSAHGAFGSPYNHGRVHLAHPSEGPYIYAAWQGVGQHGPTKLDEGSSYAGCKAEDGTVTPEFNDAFTTAGVITQATCTALGLGTYFGRNSTDAIPAYAANTGAFCGGYDAESCLIKIHKYTGLPVWGSTMPRIFDFEPQTDGIIVVGSSGGAASFDGVIVGGPFGRLNGYDNNWQSKVDLNGRGLYAQGIIADRSWTAGTSLAQNEQGDLFMSIMTTSKVTRMGPGAPGGLMVDLDVAICGEGDIPCEGERRFLVAKLGALTQPACVESCAAGEDIVIANGNCFIDSICYTADETAASLGQPCLACKPEESQTTWSDADTMGVSHCLIAGVCRNAEEYLPFPTGRFTTEPSGCQWCEPAVNANDWSIREGFKLRDPAVNPPGDCEMVAIIADPTAAPTASPVAPAPTRIPTLAPVAPVPEPTSIVAGANDNDDGADVLSGGAIAGIAIAAVVVLILIALLAKRHMNSGKQQHQEATVFSSSEGVASSETPSGAASGSNLDLA